MQFIIFLLLTIFSINNADLRMASTPKGNFIVQNSEGSIPFVPNLNANYMEPSDFNYQGLKNQRANNYDNFLRSNIDNEQDNRNFNNEIGRDMLPFRTLEANSINNNIINAVMGEKTLIPLRWNNPHSSECEINIWLKSGSGDNNVVPIKKPSCCGEGYQDNVIDFTIPNDFNKLPLKVPGFNGCNKIGDCTLQIYAHSVEPRTYAIGTPIIIANTTLVPGTYNVVPQIEKATVDPQLNLNVLPNDICLPTTNEQSNKISAVPRFARLVSDQFNHAYQNSDFSPYSGQQHELISRNLQSATILRMTAANGGELGKSILTNENKKFIETLINNVNTVVQKYETTANNIINKIKNQYQNTAMLGQQQLATCFRCPHTGSVNPQRIEQQTYIPSFEIKDSNLANQIRNNLPSNVKNLIPINSQNVQIYYAALKEMSNDFANAASKGFVYQPAMLKTSITTMNDPTNFLKVDETGKKDNGVYSSTIALSTKIQNINKVTNLFTNNIPPSVPSPTTRTLHETSLPFLPTIDIPSPSGTLPPNPDDQSTISMSNFCGKTYDTVDCNKPCFYGLDSECDIGTICFNTDLQKCTPVSNNTITNRFCGVTYEMIDCNRPCISGLNSECSGYICFQTDNCIIDTTSSSSPTTIPNIVTTKSDNLDGNVDSNIDGNVDGNTYFCGIDQNNFNCSQPCKTALSSECSNDNTILCLNIDNLCNNINNALANIANNSIQNTPTIIPLLFTVIILFFASILI